MLNARVRLICGLVMGTAFALLVAGIAAAAVSSGSYSGTTSQPGQAAGTVHFKVTKNKAIVQGFSGDVWATCSKASTPTSIHITIDPTSNISIRKHAFKFSGRFNIDNGSVVIAKRVQGKIAGLFGSGHQATGTMSFSWTFDSNAGATLKGLHCTTGKASWTAKHK